MSVVGSSGTVSFQFGVTGQQVVIDAMNMIVQGMTKLESGAKQMMSGLATQGMGTLPADMGTFGANVEAAGTKTQTFVQRMSGFQGNLLTAATSVGTFTASLFGIDAAMDNLTRSEISLEQARVRQDRMMTTLHAQEQRLNEMRTSGNYTAAEIAVQEERINTTRQQTEVQTERVSFMQQNLNEDYAQFASQILPQVITATLSGVTAMTSMVTLIGKSDTAVKLLNTGWSSFKSALDGLLPKMTQTNGAVTSVTGSSALLAKSLGVAGAVVGTMVLSMALYANNVGGARDAMNQWGVQIGQQVPALKGFLDVLGQLGVVITETFNPKTRFTMDFINEGLNEIRTRSIPTLTDLQMAVEGIIEPVAGAGTAMVAFGTKTQNAAVLLLDLKTQADMLTKTFAPMVDMQEDVTGIFYDFSQDLLGFIDVVRTVPSLGPLLAQVLKSWNDKLQDGKVTMEEFSDLLEVEVVQLIQESAQLINKELSNMVNTAEENFKQLVAEIDTAIGPTLANVVANIKKATSQLSGETLNFAISQTTATDIKAIVAEFAPLIKGMEETTTVTQTFAKQAMPEFIKAFDLAGGVTQQNTDFIIEWAKNVLKAGDAPDYVKFIMQSLIDTFGDATDKADAYQLTLSDTDKEYAQLIKEVTGLEVANKNQLASLKPLVETQKIALDVAEKQHQAAVEQALDLGVSTEALKAFAIENDFNTESIEQKTLAIVELSTEQVKWNQITDGSTQSLIKLKEAQLEGVLQFKEFYDQLVLNEEQSEAFGKALSTNVLEILEKMPDAISEVADAMRSTLPETFKSLADFEGMITPFDKDSIKEFKKELEDMDISKHTKKLAVKAADVWQDKAEIIKEGEVLFAAISGTISNKFKEIDVKDVTSWLDDIQTRVDDWESEAGPSVMTTGMTNLINEIRNSKDPVKTFMDNWEKIQAMWDPKGINDVSTATNLLGTAFKESFADPVIQNLELTNQLLAEIAGVDLKPTVSQIQALQKELLKQGDLGGAIDLALGKVTPEQQEQMKGFQKKTGAGTPDETAKAWEDAKTRIETATTAISTAVNNAMTLMGQGISGFQNVITTSMGIVDAKIIGSQGVFTLYSTNVTSNSTLMQQSVSGLQAVEVAALGLIDAATVTSDAAWSKFQTDHAVYTQLMTDNVTTFGDTSVEKLAAVDDQSVTTDSAMSKFQTNWAVYMMVMTDQVEAWSEATVKAFDAVEKGADKAETAVKGLADAISALKDKTVTIKVDVQESSTSSQQYGGVKLLTHPQYVFGGEGHKPEIHMTFPLDQMSQSHATSAFKLPFDLGDLKPPNLSGATLQGIGGGGANVVYPSRLYSNVRMNANLRIDLSSEIKKVVRQEIETMAVTRLDRMAF